MIANNVTATVSTRNRMHTTMPLMLVSLLNQTVKPSKLIVYDDNDSLEDLRGNEIYHNLFNLLERTGIAWEVNAGERKGQIHNHQRALREVKTDWVWRLDDDNILDANVLEGMLQAVQENPKIGAVGPLILNPKHHDRFPLASNKIEDVLLGVNIQWCYEHRQPQIQVDHLQGSTFLFRKEAAKHGYEMRLSRPAHREETIFTYEIKRAGWDVVVLTGLRTWHMRYGSGGIRSSDMHFEKLFIEDEKVFRSKLKEWGVKVRDVKVVPLDGGIGDHYALKTAFKDVFKTNTRVIIGACYPEIFSDVENVEIISLQDCNAIVKNPENYNIYRWMDNNNWKQSLSLAFKKMYNV